MFSAQWSKLRISNWSLTVTAGVILAVGIAFVSSATESAGEAFAGLWFDHLARVALGICCYVFFMIYDYRHIRRMAWPLYVAAVILLILVLLIGTVRNSAKSWLLVFGFGLQPSEVAKLAVVVLLARTLGGSEESVGSFRTIAQTVVLAGLPMLLVLQEPDLGTAMIFPPLILAMMFVAGVSLRKLGILAGIGVGLMLMLASAIFLPEKLGMSEQSCDRIASFTGLTRNQRERLKAFVEPERDPLGANWNKIQSRIAIGSGGFFGKGYKNGTQNTLGYLPSSVAPTDFIYPVIAEETGFAGSVSVLLLFGALLAHTLMTALAARERMGCLLCVGVAAVIFSHVFINIAMTVGLLPITGLPLPLVSYGGSFTVVMMSALGIVQNVYIRSRRSLY